MTIRSPGQGSRTPDSSPAARNLAEWFRQLERALRTARTHGPRAEAIPPLVAKLVEGFAGILEYHSPLVLRCAPLEICLGEEPVARPEPANEDGDHAPEQAIPFLFYRDGIRGLTFDERASRSDIRTLVEALLRVVGSPGTDEDLVSLLWDASLDGMHVELAPLEQIVAQLAAGTPPPAEGPPVAAAPPSQPPALPPATALPEATPPVDPVAAWRELAALEGATVERWREAWNQDAARCWPERVAELVRAVRAIDDGPGSRETLARALASTFTTALRRGDWAEAAQVLEHLRSVDPGRMWTPRLLTEGLAAVDARTLTERLDAAAADEQSRFFTLTVRIGRSALDLVVRVLSRSTQSRLRASATTVLSYICAEDVRALAYYLRDARWHVARNIVFALGQIGGEEIVMPLSLALRHLDVRVRRAAVTALGQVPLHRRTPMLIAQLEAADPATLPAVLVMMVREPDPRAAVALLNAIVAPDFEARTEDARVELVHAVGEIGDDRAVPVLDGLLNAGGWFARPSAERTAAARALGQVGSANALERLQAGQRSRSEAVRAACTEALAHAGRAA